MTPLPHRLQIFLQRILTCVSDLLDSFATCEKCHKCHRYIFSDFANSHKVYEESKTSAHGNVENECKATADLEIELLLQYNISQQDKKKAKQLAWKKKEKKSKKEKRDKDEKVRPVEKYANFRICE